MKKKLIEVALPLEAINKESAREKSIRHGHPSTLHLWWARRPLATARAVIWASLVDDPSSHPEQFPTEEAQNKERERLFDILRELVIWENSNNQDVLNRAKKEILRSTDGNPPALLDPFAGGGAIPLEAQRLGLKAYASDLNPVAVMINKAMIEIPPRFAGMPPVNPDARHQMSSGNGDKTWEGAAGLAEDVRYYGQWMKEQAFQRIGHLYPKVKDENGVERTVIAWIWARTVTCPNPACGCEMPLVSSFVLSQKKGNERYLVPNVKQGNIIYQIRKGVLNKQEYARAKYGTKYVDEKGRGKNATFNCPTCNSGIVSGEYADSEANAGRIGSKLLSVVVETDNGKEYLDSNNADVKALESATKDYYESRINEFLIPTQGSRGTFASNAQGRRYGFHTFSDYFTARQLITLSTLCEIVGNIKDIVREHIHSSSLIDDTKYANSYDEWVSAYGTAIKVYLSFVIDKLSDYHSSVCSWSASRDIIRNTFGRQAIPMVWDYAEGNPFSNSSGSISNMITWVAKVLDLLPKMVVGEVKQFDAQSDNGLRHIMISTDPPYYDNISYGDLSDFFYVWMRESLKDEFPKLFKTMLVPKAEELIATPYRFEGSVQKARDFFEDGMLKTFRQIFTYAREDVPVTVYYAYKQSDNEGEGSTASTGWETMLSAIIQAGFSITGTWPVRTELSNRMIGMDANALASSIVLVCRKRAVDAPVCTRRDFITTLKRELRPALTKLQSVNIAPVDLAQSAIGPGMGVYSRFSQVLEADGSPMNVRSALAIINQELDLFFTEQDGELDRDSRFCIDLYSQYAFNEMKFGEADVLARAKNTSVERLAAQNILYAQKGVVRLLTREEIPQGADNQGNCIWLLTQQLTRAMEVGGVQAVAKMIVPILGSDAERAKALAYRLYTLAERKGWAKEAYAYNALVLDWQGVQMQAADLASKEVVQEKWEF